jgi:hypothetical protein
MPGKAAKQAVEWTEADRFRPMLGLGSITTMINIVHRLGGPERSRVSLGEPPAFFEHDDLRRFREASQREGSRSTIVYRDRDGGPSAAAPWQGHGGKYGTYSSPVRYPPWKSVRP